MAQIIFFLLFFDAEAMEHNSVPKIITGLDQVNSDIDKKVEDFLKNDSSKKEKLTDYLDRFDKTIKSIKTLLLQKSKTS